MDLLCNFWLIPPDLCCIVIGAGAAAGCGFTGTANSGDYGADDPWRSQEPPALSAQRSKQLFRPTHTHTHRHTNTHYIRYSLLWKLVMVWMVLLTSCPSFFLLSSTPLCTLPNTASIPHFVVLNLRKQRNLTWRQTEQCFTVLFTLSPHLLSLGRRMPPARSYPRSKRWSRWQGKSLMAWRT